MLRKPRRKKIWVFCVDGKIADYKDVEFVRRYVNDRGRILPRSHTGCCATHQRVVAKAVKRSRQIGFLPYVVD